MIAATTLDWKLLLTIGVLIVLAMVLAYRLMRRDSTIARTRYGFFVERDRFEDEPPDGWPQLEPPEHQTLPAWTDRTAELPPNIPPENP
jgi:hypothetical protein